MGAWFFSSIRTVLNLNLSIESRFFALRMEELNFFEHIAATSLVKVRPTILTNAFLLNTFCTHFLAND